MPRSKHLLKLAQRLDRIRESGFRDELGEKLKELKPNDTLNVYHGTPLFRLPLLINGFDATQERSRDYNQNKHKGLFVTLELDLAKRFGSGAVIEFRARAKNLHGTDYSGNIGRKKERTNGPKSMDWIYNKYPDSFRPYLTYSLLQTGEPQALFLGITKPSDILNVWIRNHASKEWDKQTRRDLMEMKKVYNRENGRDLHLEDTGIGLADPKLSLDDFAGHLGKEVNKSAESVKETLLKIYDISADRVQRVLEEMNLNGGYLGRHAVDSLMRQLEEASRKRSNL